MDLVGFAQFVIDYFMHLDKNLSAIVATYGILTYIILFLIIFIETGFVIMPFLPGDSLLFAVGTFAAIDTLNILVLFITLSIAAILGDTVNYWIGHFVGPKAFKNKNWLLNKEHLHKTQKFYEEHGGKTIILARFMPIIRTFAPFVAGIGKMNYSDFIKYNIIGGLSWVTIMLMGGYLFGNIHWVKDNFSLVIALIIVASVIPGIYEFLKNKVSKRNREDLKFKDKK